MSIARHRSIRANNIINIRDETDSSVNACIGDSTRNRKIRCSNTHWQTLELYSSNLHYHVNNNGTAKVDGFDE